jgi:oxygen-independent coproporphyrinogen-3 oxidase
VTGEPFALYVHLPWCRHVCPYCDFNVYAAATPPEGPYVDALGAELAAQAGSPPWAGRTVGTVYLGGGTPSLFSPAAVGRVLAAVAQGPGLAADAEVTLEANPGTVSRQHLADYRAAGVNRLSLGAQSFHAGLLHTIGRDHGPEDTRAAVAAARAAGFENVSLDLLFAVPGETPALWEDELAAAVALAPTHISAYSLTYEEGTPFHAWRARGRLAPVGEDDEAAMAEAAATLLPAAGYARYEISSFARPGFAARHNLAYWQGADYLGLGAGAHSFSREPAPGRRWMNERLPARYLAAVAATGSAVAGGESLTEATARGEFALCGLRQTAGVDTLAFRSRFGIAFDAAFPHVAGLVAEGLLERAEERRRLTARGLRFADTVAATFL